MSDLDSAMKVRQDDKTLLLATVYGPGAAGTADPGVHSVQGIAGMTPLQVQNVDADISGVPVGTTSLRAFGTVAAVASGVTAATAIATAAVPATKTAYVRSFKGSSSGLARYDLLAGATLGAGVAVCAPIFTGQGNLTKESRFEVPVPVAGGGSGTNIMVQGTNRDKAAFDLFAEIEAYV